MNGSGRPAAIGHCLHHGAGPAYDISSGIHPGPVPDLQGLFLHIDPTIFVEFFLQVFGQ